MMEEFKKLLRRMGLTEKAFEQNFLKTKQMKYDPLMEIMLRFNGKPYESFYQFLDKEMKGMELILTAPKKWGKWIFNDPIKELRILPNGLGSIMVLEGEISPGRWILENSKFQKAMVRFIIERAHPNAAFGLVTPEKFFEIVHNGIIPYLIRIVAYTRENRYKIDINIPRNEVIADIRWGKIPPKLFKRRTNEEYFMFDKVYSTIPLPRFSKLIFETVFESNGMDLETLALIFNVPEEILRNNLGVLIKHNLVEEDKSTEMYRVKFLKAAP
ncbi:MAG: hypothetical protein GXO25_01035 [Euryarchaeota archaeon]|nr:hypothetical protein [Euryarchaeota archaeon]